MKHSSSNDWCEGTLVEQDLLMRELMAVLALAEGQSKKGKRSPQQCTQLSHSVLLCSYKPHHQPNLIVLLPYTPTPFLSEYSTSSLYPHLCTYNYSLPIFDSTCCLKFLIEMMHRFFWNDFAHVAATSSSLQQVHVHHALTM